MTDNGKNSEKKNPTTSFTVGAIALVFLAIGYQTALFIHKAAVATVVANKDMPDTVYVYPDGTDGYPDGTDGYSDDAGNYSEGAENTLDYSEGSWKQGFRDLPDQGASGTRSGNTRSSGRRGRIVRKNSSHSEVAAAIREKYSPRTYESFRFDPNTVSVEDLMRLGFSQKQAQSIDNYRKAGGRFRKKEDFAKSYVVEDSVYRRLEKFISIPKIDINKADSTTFDSLPGIGPYFASRMVSYRKRLGGYSYAEQLMDIPKFDQDKFAGIRDMISVSPPRPYPLWTLPEDSLAMHPYLDKYSAHSIVLFRNNSPKSEWTVEKLAKAGILSPEKAEKLGRCVLE